MWHAWERREILAGFWLETPNERDPFGRSRHRWEVEGEIIPLHAMNVYGEHGHSSTHS